MGKMFRIDSKTTLSSFVFLFCKKSTKSLNDCFREDFVELVNKDVVDWNCQESGANLI